MNTIQNSGLEPFGVARGVLQSVFYLGREGVTQLPALTKLRVSPFSTEIGDFHAGLAMIEPPGNKGDCSCQATEIT